MPLNHAVPSNKTKTVVININGQKHIIKGQLIWWNPQNVQNPNAYKLDLNGILTALGANTNSQNPKTWQQLIPNNDLQINHENLNDQGLIPVIHALLNNQNQIGNVNLNTIIPGLKATSPGLPVIVYIHCQCGRDRTGFVNIAYKMEYSKMSLPSAWLASSIVNDQPYSSDRINTIRAYCRYLQLTQDYETNKPQICGINLQDDERHTHPDPSALKNRLVPIARPRLILKSHGSNKANIIISWLPFHNTYANNDKTNQVTVISLCQLNNHKNCKIIKTWKFNSTQHQLITSLKLATDLTYAVKQRVIAGNHTTSINSLPEKLKF